MRRSASFFLAALAFGGFLASWTAAAEPNAWEVYEPWPFSAEEAVRRQTETAKALKLPVELKVPVSGKEGPTLNWRLIPAGKYLRGSPKTENGHEGDETLRPETVAEPFYMLETQLTLAQYRALLGTDPPGTDKDADGKLPAGMTYRDTVDNVLPALAKVAPEGWKVILSDRTRLEYAARAGVATMTPGGDKPEDAADYAWSRENSQNQVHPVAQKKPNAWGLFDVIGNRWHWFWEVGGGGYGDGSTKDHIVYGGNYASSVGGNGVRLANIMISSKSEGARFALIKVETPLPKGHPETAVKKP
jgi:formylglycine-generating enzyme required for sulfatase activity